LLKAICDDPSRMGDSIWRGVRYLATKRY